jgi:hypothetical protein
VTQQAATNVMPPIDDARIAEAHRQLLADKSIQFDLVPFTIPKPPAWLAELLKFLTSPAFKWAFWIVVGLLALAFIALLLHRFWGVPLPWKRGRPKEEAEEVHYWQPQAEPARALLREADALAAEGRFDEAAHLLLFRSIEDIESRRPRLVRPALTSRDIAGAPEIPSRARTAFGAIVMMVERSLFARRQLAETDWRECREAYERFAFAEAWR